jgi:hypothetical protein
MDIRFERIQSHFEACLQQAGMFERAVDGAHLFENGISEKAKHKWLVIAAGISDNEASSFFLDQHKRERALVPIQISPNGQISILLILRPFDQEPQSTQGRYITDFSIDVERIEIYQGSYVRVDGLTSPAIHQIRWELDPITGHKPPREEWLRPWGKIIGCNPAHPPSHWHINSPPIEVSGRRQRRKVVTPPELRLAVGLPNPLLLVLSLANWLRQAV